MKKMFIGLLFPAILHAQHQPLRIGDPLPPLLIRNVLNHNAPSVYLADYKDKLLILDFMSVGCIACLRALPAIDSLSKALGFSVILVTPDTKQRITSFLQKRPLPFPIIPADSTLGSFFPHTFISHIAWICHGRVAAITGSEYITAGNISALLDGNPVSLPVKSDRPDYDYNVSLLPPAPLNDSIRSVLLSSLPGVPRRFGQGVDAASAARWFRFINYPILPLFYKSWGLPFYWPREQLQLAVSDTTRFIYDRRLAFRQQWDADNTFCYEASLPASLPPDSCWQWIRNDLAARLGIHAALIQHPVPTVIIRDEQHPDHPVFKINN